MKITVSKSDLAALISAAAHFAGTTSMYDNVVFSVQDKMILISAFNGTMGLKVVVPADIELAENEMVKPFGVSANLLKELVGTLDGDVTLCVDNEGRLEVRAAKSKSRLSVNEAAQELQLGKWPELCSMSGAALHRLLPLTEFAAGENDGSRVLTGIFIRITDGSLLAYGANLWRSCFANLEVEVKQAGQILVPAIFLRKVGKVVLAEDTVTIYSNGEHILFGICHKASRRALTAASPALAGEFPLEQLQGLYSMVPSHQAVIVKTADMLAALARIRAVEAGVTRLSSNKKTSMIESQQENSEQAIGRSRTELPFAWEGLDIFLPCRSLAASISAIGGEELHMAFRGNTSAVYMWNETYRFIIMPMAMTCPTPVEIRAEEAPVYCKAPSSELKVPAQTFSKVNQPVPFDGTPGGSVRHDEGMIPSDQSPLEGGALDETRGHESDDSAVEVIPPGSPSSKRTLKERQGEFRATLAHACGSAEFYVHGGFWAMPITLTEGVHFVVENGGRSEGGTAYWLADILASYQGEAKLLRMDLQFWRLELVVEDGVVRGGVVTCGNGNGKEIVRQELDTCDFILDEGIELYVGWNYMDDPKSKTGYRKIRTILLPSEY